jgi:ABC-2 type transport system ATP-binding protein
MGESIAIRTDNLSKTFGRGHKAVRAVKDLNLEVRARQVYGFLGPNGAGKTTTIRMLMNLIRPSRGTVRLYDRPVTGPHRVLDRVGAIVERAAFYDYLCGQRNLEVLARTSGCCDAQRIGALLAQVGLAGRAQQRVGAYSTGMKQRLGLAAALLHDPDLLILDEPTGGLDPAGIQEIRLFLRDLVERKGKTIFLSSHLLGEVEQVCDRVAIIHKGELVGEGGVAELLAGKSRLCVDAAPLDGAAEVLRQTWPIAYDGQRLVVRAQRQEAPHVVRRLVAQGIDVYRVSSQRQTLETFFMQVTQEENPDAV